MSNDRALLELKNGDALLVIDVQNDFLPGGSVAVPHGDEILAPLNRYLHLFTWHKLPVFASRDWHPAHHSSFFAEGGAWPAHCVAKTPGAAFPAALKLPRSALIVSKGCVAERDSHSAFSETRLELLLKKYGVERLFVAGLAADYCVLYSVRDALHLGLQVVVLSDAVRAMEVFRGDGEQAFAEMEQLGAQFAQSAEVVI